MTERSDKSSFCAAAAAWRARVRYTLCVLALCVDLSGWAAPPAAPMDRATAEALAESVYRESGVRGGLVVQAGLGDGELTLALCRGAAFTVDCLARTPDALDAARAKFATGAPAGIVGGRLWTGAVLPYADDLVNLFVAEAPLDVPMTELLRVLAPRGVALVRTGDAWEKTVKAWPQELDEWTHWLHGADGNPVGRDTRVGPPRSVQWIASPLWSKSHDANPSLEAMVSAGGRVFYMADIGPVGIGSPDGSLEDWALCARDAFNGILLWQTRIADWGSRAWSPGDGVVRGKGPWVGTPRDIHKRVVAWGDSVFATLGFRAPVSRLDAATGDIARTFEGTEFATEIILDGDILLLGVDRAAQAAGRYTDTPAKSVMALNPQTGKVLWQRDGFQGVEDKKQRKLEGKLTRLSLTAGGGKVYVYEGDVVVALDARTGEERWRSPGPERRPILVGNKGEPVPAGETKTNLGCPLDDDWGELMYSDGVVYCWRPHSRAVGWQHEMELIALSSEDGTAQWHTTCSGAGHYTLVSVHKAQGLVWVNSKKPDCELWGLDPASGQIARKYDLREFMNSVHHHRCYRTKATENFLIYSRNGVEFLDFASGQMSFNPSVRGICAYGIMPANGLIYAPPEPCSCFPSARAGGLVAYGPTRSRDANRAVAAEARVEKGPAFAATQEKGAAPSDTDWSMYRHDPQRTGATACTGPREVAERWQRDLGEPLTAPIVALGKVFLCGRRTHRIYALDAQTGSPVWTFAADGLVDTPPTIRNGSAYFGTRDGCVYRLRAADGKMVWRFDANPERALIVVHGQIESAWPVIGSVIVENDVVYFAAGRSSYLDGGLHVYALDANNGAALRHFNHCSVTDEVFGATRWLEQTPGQNKPTGKLLAGTRNDLFTSGKGGSWLLLTGGQNDLPTWDTHGLHIKNLSLDPVTFEPRYNGWQYTGAKAGMEGHVPGGMLRSVGGFLDDSLFSRSGYVLDEQLKARMMVFSETAMYAFGWGRQGTTFAFSGLLKTDEDQYAITAHGRRQAAETTGAKPTANKPLWSLTVPIRVQGMALAGDRLFIAGSPYTPDAPDKLLGAIRGEGPGVLWTIDPAKGERVAECELAAPPVWDGLAIAGDSLYVSLRNGNVVRLGGAAGN